MLVVLLAISGLATPMTVKTASAAAPAAIPSQIAISIAGGAEEGKSAMSFNWLTDLTVNNSVIVYGKSSNLADGVIKNATMSTPAAANIIPVNKQTNFKAINSFNVVIQDLIPETKYYYKVGNDSNGYSAIASFTAPANPNDKKPFSFVVSPDTQGTSVSTYDNTKKLYDYIKANEQDAAFLIHNGDIVEDASYSDYWQYFFDAADNLLSTLPIMATPGNHDSATYDQNLVQINARFNYSSLRQPSGLSPAAAGTVYSFEYGDALFISLNSNASTADNNIQYKFLADETAATTKAWKILNMHAGPYDPGSSHYTLDNVTGKKLTDAGVDLVLTGHEHAYARSTLRTTSTAAGAGSVEKAKFGEAPTYVIGGSVYNYGYSLDARDSSSWNDFFYDLRINKTGTGGGAIYSPGVYSKVEVTSNSIIYKAYYKATGSENPFRVIDTFTITKSGDKITQPIGGGKAPTSTTFMFDSFKQEVGKYIARFNWVTPVTTKETQLYYAKKSDFESNGGKFTNVIVGTNNTVDLSSNIANANYNSAGTSYSVAAIQSHKAETTVLDPGTEYVYSVGDGSRNVTNVVSPASFSTPASNLDTFNFTWISDSQQNSSSYDATLNLYTQHAQKALNQAFVDFPDASFVMSSGDQVNFGFDTWEWDAFFEANADTFARVPLYMATGNHEYDGAGNSWAPNNSWNSVDPTLQNLLGRQNPPKNGASYYGGGDGTQRMVAGIDKLQYESSNYYYIYGDTLFLVMDYQDQSTPSQIKAQEDWMKSVVKQNPTKWRVAVFHKSLFGYRMATPVLSWTNAFDQAGIDVVLMGHDHVYVRTNLFANGASIDPQAYGDGTTYITNYSSNNDRRGGLYTKDPTKVAYVDVRAVGPGYANISISPTEIRVTSKGYDTDGVLVMGDTNALVTNKPRTPNLSGWIYPAVPQDTNEFTIKSVAVTGIAKEGQTLSAAVTPSSATATFRWERSTDGSSWTAITGETSSNYKIKTADVSMYLRSVATGTLFYNGVATSSATAKVTPLGGNSAVTVKIKTANDLVAISAGFGTSAYPVDGKYELSADIDMNDVTFSAIGGGTTATPFIGTFNGRGYTIRNLKISSSNNNTGFFAYLGAGSRVVNLKLVNVDITGSNSTGAIAGTSSGTIENSYVDGKVTGSGYTGGIVGLLYAGTLQNSFVSAEVSGKTVGGLIGGTNYNNSGSPISKPDTTTGNVIINNFVKGTVTGLVGGQYFAAVVGDMGGSSGSLLKTLNGNIVTNTVNEVTPGKIAGYWSGSRPIIDSNQVNYYDSSKLTTSGLPSSISPVFVGKTASDLAQKTAFEALGWDFTIAWDWDAIKNVPVPKTIIIGGEEEDEFALTVDGGTITVDGNAVDSPVQIKEDSQVTVSATVPEGQRFVRWTATGLTNESYTANPLTFTMPVNQVTLKAEYENITIINVDLSDLMVGGTTVSGFSANTTSYTVNVPNNQSSLTVTAIAVDAKATVAIAGGDNLVVGDNTVTVTVTAEDGETTKVYTIIVKRAAAQGGGGIVTPVQDNKQTLPAGTGGTAQFTNNAVTITVPAGATEKQLTITVDKVLNTSQLLSNKDVLLSPVYEILKSFTENFLKPITLTITFDPKTIGANQIASLFYYDEAKKGWVEIGGKVSGDRITAEVNHFTKFAVFAVDTKVEESPENKPEENVEVKFSDIAGHWAEASIKQVAAQGIVGGYADGTFKPKSEVTRAEFAVLLARMLKLQGNGAALKFTDNSSIGAWAKQEIAQAVQAGIVNGYGDGSFRPNAKISRAEMVAMIANALGLAKKANAVTAFADDAEIPAWTKAAVAATVENGIVQGVSGNKFAPKQTATRAEAAVVLLKALAFASK
ncbi:S-layer homology domain-containing protein [Cohnella abietis]|nr:S-layer homology domain-containing protein [Cohnella abietis]